MMDLNNPAKQEKDKKNLLYQKQKALLDTFLEHGAISKAQYDISLAGLQEKMGIKE